MYKANLARYEMAAQHWEEAEKIWNALLASDNLEIQREAGNNLSEIASRKFAAQHGHPVRETPAAAADASLTGTPAGPQPEAEEAPQINPPPSLQSIRFVKGKLISVDCSHQPGATINVRSGGNDLVMYTTDIRHTLLIGVDTFSCSWKDRDVSINYRLKPDGRGEIVSLELD
jgi:hypothetical protein